MIKVLFLAANPKDTSQLRLGEEVREIKERLRLAKLRDEFVLEQEWAVRVSDLQDYLLQHKPHIVHFSGHGSKAGEIILEDRNGQSKPVSPEVLKRLFTTLRDNIRCIVLNACFSRTQAEAIAETIECVVGMSTAVLDDAAISFASGFYQGLGYGRNIYEAFELGCGRIQLEDLGQQGTPQSSTRHFELDDEKIESDDLGRRDIPQLVTRPDVDAKTIYLIKSRPPSPHQFQQIIDVVIQFAKARHRELATIGLAAILFWLGRSFFKWLPEELQDFAQPWRGHLIIPGVFYTAGLVLLAYSIYRIWKVTHLPKLRPAENRPSIIKGPLAFTPADGEVFRRLGREGELSMLLGYLQDDQVSLVVLMGASGAGKTSLLRAGLSHILRGTDIAYHYWEARASDSRQSLLHAIQQDLNSDGSKQPAPGLKSLDELVNAPSEIGKHVIVLDQFEQLGAELNEPIFRHLRRVARRGQPPHRVKWVIAFRREYRAVWSDFIIPEQERGFYPPEMSLRLFTSEQARQVIGQLVREAELPVEPKVLDNLIEAATVNGEVSSVDIGIGLLVLSELHERQGGQTLTEATYHFAGGAEGLLTQYISRCLDIFPDEDRKTLLSAMLALRDENTGQRIAEGKTVTLLATEIKAENVSRLRTELERLTQRDIRLLEPVDARDSEDIRYRLPHERLIPAINRLAGKLIGEREEARLKLVSAFSAWRHNPASRYLLKGRDLRLVERYQSQIPWGSDEQGKLDFLKLSKRRRAAARLISAVLISSLLAGGWLWNHQYQRYEAIIYLRENSYPPELYDYQGQLRGLELWDSFNLQYISFLNSDSLEELTISATSSTNSLGGLINSFKRCPHLKKLTLDLRGSEVKEIPPLPTSLTALTLYLGGSQVKEVPPLPPSLTALTLYLGVSQVKEIPPLPPSLTALTLYLGDSLFSGSEVKEIPPLPPSLTALTLDLRGSKVKEVPPLPPSLTALTLNLGDSLSSVSEVKEIPPLPPSLTALTLYLGDSQVKEVPPLPPSLTALTLYLRGSQVKEVPPLQQINCQTLSLYLTINQRMSLKTLPRSVVYLKL